jgi:glycosyltransferase involved in cell wall biosynthesis
MRVFMLGCEFPPFISGGLGTACYGLTKALSGIGADIMFVLPRPVSTPFSTHVRLVSPRPGSPLASPSTEFRLDEFEHVTFRTVDAQLSPYNTPADYDKNHATRADTQQQAEHDDVADAPAGTTALTKEALRLRRAAAMLRAQQHADAANTPMPGFIGNAPSAAAANTNYAGDLFSEVQRYAALASEIARQESFDVVHAHDWMTFPAGLAVAGIKGVPLVVHVHSTEFDRSGLHVDQRIYDIERRGMHGAIKVIAVSTLTKNIITQHYGVDPHKVEVVYNAIEVNGAYDEEKYKIHKDEKIVLFLGRITQQKGPEYFLAAAKKVLEVMDNVKFVMAGSGDMIRRTIEMAASMGIGHKVLFTGFLRGNDVEKVFKMADLYVMPSVSEPFGIAPLEAMAHDVPVIISKQSGVSEVVANALKVDFWDINEMANKIVAVLRHPPLATTMRQHGSFEIRKMSWTDAARACVNVYGQAIGAMSNGSR